jgi:hypothetical protein
MKEYYLHDGQNQVGPFNLEELKQRGITADTYIWKDGFADWIKAKEVKEVNDTLISTPPPFVKPNPLPPSPNTNYQTEMPVERAGKLVGRNLKVTLLVLLVVSVASYSYYKINETADRIANPYEPTIYEKVKEKTPEELRLELVQKERQNPSEYIEGKLRMRVNILGETVFEGTINNTASVAVFKDIKIRFNFLSKTKTILAKEDFVIYELLNPQQSIQIKKIKTYAPNNTENFSFSIVDATPVQ